MIRGLAALGVRRTWTCRRACRLLGSNLGRRQGQSSRLPPARARCCVEDVGGSQAHRRRDQARRAGRARLFRRERAEPPLRRARHRRRRSSSSRAPSSEPLPRRCRSPARSRRRGVSAPSAPMPNPTVSFNGLDKATFGAGFPPDTVGDVGPNHFVQAVNTSIGILQQDRRAARRVHVQHALGRPRAPGRRATRQSGRSDRRCTTHRAAAGSWPTSRSAATERRRPSSSASRCRRRAIRSTGGWFLYAFRTDDAAHPFFADYPKMGIWPDGLYMTANMFDSSAEFRRRSECGRSTAPISSPARPVRNVVIDLGTTGLLQPDAEQHANGDGYAACGTREPARLRIEQSVRLRGLEVPRRLLGRGSTFTGSPINVSQTDVYGRPERPCRRRRTRSTRCSSG